MSDLFLILHKVRGEPAFDIATRCDEIGTEEDPGPWWIIPTSGHRAYPTDWWDLDETCIMTMDKYSERYHNIQELISPIPHNWPDHYRARTSPITHLRDAGASLLAALGLEGKPFKRRRIG